MNRSVYKFTVRGMSSDEKVLEMSKSNEIPADSEVYQLEDGTFVYWTESSPARLYLKHEGEEFDAELPTDECFDYGCYGTHGNAVYLCNGEQVHKVEVTSPDSIDVSHVRNVLQCETHHTVVLSSRIIDGKTYVYRMFDVLGDGNAIVIDIPEEELKMMDVHDIHRGKVIYSEQRRDDESEKVELSARQIGPHAVAINVPSRVNSFHARDSSRFIYFATHSEDLIYTFDSKSMQFLPSIRIGDITAPTIVGVHKGEITISGINNDNFEEIFLVTAQLPEEYFEAFTQDEENADQEEEPPKKKSNR